MADFPQREREKEILKWVHVSDFQLYIPTHIMMPSTHQILIEPDDIRIKFKRIVRISCLYIFIYIFTYTPLNTNVVY